MPRGRTLQASAKMYSEMMKASLKVKMTTGDAVTPSGTKRRRGNGGGGDDNDNDDGDEDENGVGVGKEKKKQKKEKKKQEMKKAKGKKNGLALTLLGNGDEDAEGDGGSFGDGDADMVSICFIFAFVGFACVFISWFLVWVAACGGLLLLLLLLLLHLSFKSAEPDQAPPTGFANFPNCGKVFSERLDYLTDDVNGASTGERNCCEKGRDGKRWT